MGKLITFLSVLLIGSSVSFSQINPAALESGSIRKNSVYMEAFGNGAFYSLNYERLYVSDENSALAMRAGYGYAGDGMHFIPLEISLIFGSKHSFELGGGITYNYERHYSEYQGTHITNEEIMTIIRAGYRYRGKNGFLFRISPMLLYVQDWGAFPYGGLSLGYSF